MVTFDKELADELLDRCWYAGRFAVRADEESAISHTFRRLNDQGMIQRVMGEDSLVGYWIYHSPRVRMSANTVTR